ncbi:lipoprotein [Streptomyces malachitofuscus]|nr:lipoprotein [Streptomyces malachitofuscus]
MHHRRVPRLSAVAAGLTACAVLGLVGCDSGSDDSGSAASSGPSVIAPGEPGEANRTLSAEEASRQRAEDDSPNSADVTYARMMIEHHAQALEMTELVPDRAESPKIVKLAEHIAAAQQPEIKAMKGWLKSHDKAERDEGHGHDHATMPGMATQAQLKQLRAADGKAFDQLFLTLMITHHQGAITMSSEVKGQGNNIAMEEMADDVVAQQTSEIGRMRDLM